jgi:hypothetical protein
MQLPDPRRSTALAFSLSVLIALLASSPVSVSAELLFQDDFASGDLSKHNQFFRWGSASVPSPGTGAARIERVRGPNGTDVSALRFRYRGTVEEGATGDAAHWSEQRFHLTQSTWESRSANGPSSVAHQEVWVRYAMLLPPNYQHVYPQVAGSNQKGWLTLWKDAYSESWPPKQLAMFGFWRLTDADQMPFGREWPSTLSATHVRDGGTREHNRFLPTSVMDTRYRLASTNVAAFLPGEYGTWVDFAFGFRAADPGRNNGFIRLYRNGIRLFAWENLENSNSDSSLNGVDRGYLMGYHNASYERTTVFYLTDFRIATSAAGVGLYQVAAKPNPPELRVE